MRGRPVERLPYGPRLRVEPVVGHGTLGLATYDFGPIRGSRGRVANVERATPIDVIDTVCFPSLSTFEPPPFSPGSRGALQKERHVSPSFPAASLAKRDRTFVVLRMGRRSYGRGRVCVRGCLTRLLELPCPLCAMQPPSAGCMPGSGGLTGAARRAGRQPSRCANSSHGHRPHSRCGHATKNVTGARSTGARSDGSFLAYCWFPWAAFMACSIFSFRSPTLKLAPACIGGYSTKLGRYFSITCAEIW